MSSKEFSSNKKNNFAKQSTQNLKICEKKSIFHDSVTDNQNLNSCENLSKKPKQSSRGFKNYVE